MLYRDIYDRLNEVTRNGVGILQILNCKETFDTLLHRRLFKKEASWGTVENINTF